MSRILILLRRTGMSFGMPRREVGVLSVPASLHTFSRMCRRELKIAMDAAREAGALMLNYYGGSYEVENKIQSSPGAAHPASVRSSNYDPVTSADIEADACLKSRLRAVNENWGWLSEETADSAQRLKCETVWIVDPMDGTKEFLEGIPEFAVSIGLVQCGVPIVAVVYNPHSGELFSAISGGGAFLNGRRIFCNGEAELTKAIVGVSRSELARGEVERFAGGIGGAKPIGSIAYKLAVVAAGGTDMNISVQPKNEWDVCAGDLLVREAGGTMVDLDGQVRTYNRENPRIEGGLVAGNQRLTEAALDLLARR